jgi:hypothetical protein
MAVGGGAIMLTVAAPLLLSDQLRDPDRRFELQLALRVRQLDESRMTGRGNPSRSARLDREPSTGGQP